MRIYSNIIKLFKRYGLVEFFSDWQEAHKKTSSYEDTTIVEKVFESALKVKNKEWAFERDGVLFSKYEYSFPVLSALFWIYFKSGEKLNLVDFGGSFGSTYFQYINFISTFKHVKWNIVEQQKFVSLGKAHFQDDRLRFFAEFDEAIKFSLPNALLLFSSLQYLEFPYEFLRKVFLSNFEFIVIDRTPVIYEDKDLVAMQKVDPKIYQASYPCWIFSDKKLRETFNNRYTLLYGYKSIQKPFHIKNHRIFYSGYVFVRKDFLTINSN